MNILISSPLMLTEYETELLVEDEETNSHLLWKAPGVILLAAGVISMFAFMFLLDYSAPIFSIPIFSLLLGGVFYSIGSKLDKDDEKTRNTAKQKVWDARRKDDLEKVTSWAKAENIILDEDSVEKLMMQREILLVTGQKATLRKASDGNLYLFEV